MNADELQEHLSGLTPDDTALARELDADPALHTVLARADGLAELQPHLRSLAEAEPLPAEVAKLIERLAARAPAASDDSQDPRPGTEEPTDLGNYTGLTLIGRGGMGAVYRAIDARLRREVALKTLNPALATNPDARARFQREARAAAALSHPNILPIHAIETIEGRDVLVMPLNDGENLHSLIRRDGPLPVDEIIRLGAAVADGLAAAHAAGIFHCDIKPANLLLSADRQSIRIADFGLAHIADDPAHTHSAILAGTPHFLAPEQAKGKPADTRSDLFALGATLYFMATGQLPFPGEQTTSVLHAVAHQPHQPVRRVRRTLPPWLSALIDALLSKDPAHRPSSAAEVARALGQRSPRWSHRQRTVLGVRLALLLFAVALAAFAITRWQAWHRAQLQFVATHPFHVSGSQDTRFATLDEALAAAGDGDLVLLENGGTFPLPAQNFHRRSLTLRALPRAGAVIQPVSTDTILFTTAARLRLENLTLEHPPAAVVAAPLFIAETGANITLHRCRFVSMRLPRRTETMGENNAPLLHIAGGAKAVIEHTLVVANRRALAQFLPGPSGVPAEIQIANSALAINTLLVREERDPPGNLTLRQSTISVAALLWIAPRTVPVKFSVHRCFIDSMRSLVFAPALDTAAVGRALGWSGDENIIHCEGAPLNFLPATTDRTFTLFSTRPALDEWRTLFPGNEQRSVETTASFRTRLARSRTNRDPITASDFTLPPHLQRQAPHIGAPIDEIGPE